MTLYELITRIFSYHAKLFLFFMVFIVTNSNAQQIPATNGTHNPCNNCTPPGWEKGSSLATPDISNRDYAGGPAGLVPWNNAPLPLPPNSHTSWITLRDVGSLGAEESVRTTISDLVAGKEYELILYTMSSDATGYSPKFIDYFRYEVQGTSAVNVDDISQNIWSITKVRFTASASSVTFTIYPGANMGSNPANYESISISISLNALNEPPIAVDDDATTAMNTSVTLNITSNDSDPDGSINVSSVDLDPSTPGIQNVFTSSEGSWSVNSLGLVTFMPATGFIGTASIPYTIQDNYSIDGVSVPATSLSANISITVGTTNTTCDPDMFLSTSSSITHTSLVYRVDNTTVPFTYTAIGSAISTEMNGMGYNTVDNYLYAMGVNYSTAKSYLVKIDPTDGTYVFLDIPGIPYAGYTSGAFDENGNYYVKPAGTSDIIQKIDVTNLTFTTINLNSAFGTSDFTYDPVDDLFYFVSNYSPNRGDLGTFNVNTGEVNYIGGDGVDNFLGMYASSSGNLFGSKGGNFFQINKSTGVQTLISTAPNTSDGDGANCILADIVFESDLYITKTDNKDNYIPGTTNTYTITVGNNGPFGVQGAKVSDPVPSGIPASNVSYTASVSGGARTSVSGTQVGAINDLVDLPVGGLVTYTVTIDIPVLFTGNLTNVATIATPTTGYIDTDLTNNEATDTDTTNVCYKSPNTDTPSGYTKVGITVQKKQDAWPENIPNGWIALESKEKGFVITRVSHVGGTDGSPVSTDAVTEPKEGMMVYDIADQCVKLYNGTVWNCMQKSCNE